MEHSTEVGGGWEGVEWGRAEWSSDGDQGWVDQAQEVGPESVALVGAISKSPSWTFFKKNICSILHMKYFKVQFYSF